MIFSYFLAKNRVNLSISPDVKEEGKVYLLPPSLLFAVGQALEK
jgi:hypothetical protein